MARYKKEIVSVKSENKIAKQPNSISRAIFCVSSMGYKIIVYSLFKTTENGTSDYTQDFNLEVQFSVWEFAKHLGIEKSGTLTESVRKACTELIKSSITCDDEEEHKFYVYPFFSKIVFDEENNTITAKFNNDLMVFFKQKGYSALEILTVGSIQSFYALRYYALAKSYSGNPNAYFAYTEKELRQLFEIPNDEYRDRRDFTKRVIRLPIREINEKTIYEITAEKKKIAVGDYKWTFNIEIKENLTKPLPIKKKDTKKEKDEKKEINTQNDIANKLMIEHKDEFNELFEIQLNKTFLNRKQTETEARENAKIELMKRYGYELE